MLAQPSIYEQFLQHCGPYRLRGPWHNVTLDADCRACSPWGTVVLAELAETFGERELVASDIARELPDGLIVNPALVGELNGIVALRVLPDAPPYALLTAAGVMVPAEASLPAMTILHDQRTQELLRQRDQRLYVVFTVEAAILMRGLGFPVTLMNDFFPTNIVRLEELRSACRWATPVICNIEQELRLSVPEPQSSKTSAPLPVANCNDAEPTRQEAPPASAEDADTSARIETDPAQDHSRTAEVATPSCEDLEPVDVVLVAWSPVELTLDQPRQFPAVVVHLLQLAKYLRVDISRIAAWRPTLEELARMTFCLRVGSVSAAAEAFAESADRSLFMLHCASEQAEGAEPAVLSYEEARKELDTRLRATAGNQDVASLQKARDDFENVVERDLVAPLRRVALTADDPARRCLGGLAADLARSIHGHAPFVTLGAGGQLDPKSRTAGVSAAGCNMNTYLKMTNTFLTVLRELRS